MLISIPGVLSKEEVRNYREHMDSAPWLDGRLTAGGQAKHVKTNQQLDDKEELTRHLSETLIGRLNGHPTFVSAALPNKIFPPKFNRYQDGGHYGLHIDNAIMSLANGQRMRTDVSATLFLSEPDEYDGGELTIETQFGAQQVKLEAGDLIVYPSTSLHEVKAVTRGSRVCSFFWVQSLVKDSAQREQLFELDQSIQVLTVDRGYDDAEVRRLTGIYHNLVRTWSDC